MLTVTAAATGNYNAATRTVTINISKATPTITWAHPADITETARAVCFSNWSLQLDGVLIRSYTTSVLFNRIIDL